MKTDETTLKLILGVELIATLLSLVGIDCRPERAAEPFQNALRPRPPERSAVAQGERLVLMNCAHCHSNNEGRLTGQPMVGTSPSLGRIVSANITQDFLQGIGRWSDAQLITLLRTGIDPNGHKAHFIMPRYPLMADTNMRAVIAFLRSDA